MSVENYILDTFSDVQVSRQKFLELIYDSYNINHRPNPIQS